MFTVGTHYATSTESNHFSSPLCSNNHDSLPISMNLSTFFWPSQAFIDPFPLDSLIYHQGLISTPLENPDLEQYLNTKYLKKIPLTFSIMSVKIRTDQDHRCQSSVVDLECVAVPFGGPFVATPPASADSCSRWGFCCLTFCCCCSFLCTGFGVGFLWVILLWL